MTVRLRKWAPLLVQGCGEAVNVPGIIWNAGGERRWFAAVPLGHLEVVTVVGRSRGVLVTGATSGLGRAVALRFAREQVPVGLVGRSEADLDQAMVEVQRRGVHAVALQIDLADSTSLPDLVDRAVSEIGRIGVLVNAAATDAPGPAEDLGLDDWNRVLAVNLTAPFVLARAVMPHMRAAGGGLIINVSSVAGRRGWADASAYCSTKFALTGLTQSLAAEGRADGIRVCVLYPGAMATSWGTFDRERRHQKASDVGHDPAESLDPATAADLIAWMATAPGEPVLNEVTVTPLHERGWP
jgi:NAD(P)-dependent dehydrogenase (short-subunit alcohol dehydrogenase family)